jgi:electron transfer flavoprotein alpha subunit
VGRDHERTAVAQLRTSFRGDIVVLPAREASAAFHAQLLRECWQAAGLPIPIAVAEPWALPVFEGLAGPRLPAAVVAGGVCQIDFHGDHAVLATSRQRGKVLARQVIAAGAQVPSFVTLAAEVRVSDNRSVLAGRLKPFKADALHDGRVCRWQPKLERFYGRDDIQRLLQAVREDAGLIRLSDADFIIDVGFGVGNRDGYEAVIEPLAQVLRQLGVRGLAIGGSRKVTEELHLLPADRQIGQSGVSVRPRILLAIGISGAPQHLDYIGGQASIIAFNRDPEAPLMTLGRRQPRPRVYPVVGDLFQTVPALTAALRQERPAPGLALRQ